MTAITYVTPAQMLQRTGFRTALGYAFPKEDKILILKNLPAKVEREVRAHEEEHISKGEEGPLLGALIGAGASILGGVLGSKSGDKAARAQERASRDQIAFERESRDMALRLGRPQREAGYAATAAMMDMAGLRRPQRKKPGSAIEMAQNPYSGVFEALGVSVPYAMPAQQEDEFSAPDLGDFEQYDFRTDPGYQFRMDESMRALDRSASSRGRLNSGGHRRAALRYAQNFASGEYMNIYNRLATLAGYGQVASQSGQQVVMNSGFSGGDAIANAGAARGSAYIASGNAWSNALDQVSMIDWSSAFKKPQPVSTYAGYEA